MNIRPHLLYATVLIFAAEATFANSNPVSVTNMQNYVEQSLLNYDAAHRFHVGDFYDGGVVCAVDSSGQHGLAVSIDDQSTNAPWWGPTCTDSSNCPSIGTVNANGMGGGIINTASIIAAQSQFDATVAGTAALLASNNTVRADTGKNTNNECSLVGQAETVPSDFQCIGDWYLPSQQEFALCLAAKALVNATIQTYGGTLIDNASDDSYWTSNQDDSNTINAWSIAADSDSIQAYSYQKNDTTNHTRAVRSF